MKPNPHLVWQALDKLGADPKRTILVGDSLTDIEAAKAAGVLAVGYANKPGKADRFAAAGEDRAAVIRMRRRGPGETVAPYRHRRDRPALRQLAADLSAWLRADLDTLEKAEPPMPVEDRAADTWEPLVAVADHAGHDWPDRARTTVLALTAEADDNGQPSNRVRLLADCRTAFGTDTALPTATLLERLKADPEAPWADYGPNGLTAMKLGVILREYDIRSGNIRFPDGSQAKGYQRVDFADAWTRYCPALEPLPEAEVLPFGRG